MRVISRKKNRAGDFRRGGFTVNRFSNGNTMRQAKNFRFSIDRECRL